MHGRDGRTSNPVKVSRSWIGRFSSDAKCLIGTTMFSVRIGLGVRLLFLRRRSSLSRPYVAIANRMNRGC